MYHFNLLPTLYQKQAKRWIILQHVTNGLCLINVTITIGIGLLFIGNQALNTIVESAMSSVVNIQTTTKNSEDSINIPAINGLITALTTIQKEHQNYIRLLIEFIEIIPENLYISSASINYEDSTISISGTALTRDAMKNLQYTLENDSRFEIVAFPFDVFTQSSNIPFSIEITFDPKAFTTTEQSQ